MIISLIIIVAIFSLALGGLYYLWRKTSLPKTIKLFASIPLLIFAFFIGYFLLNLVSNVLGLRPLIGPIPTIAPNQ